MGETIEYERPTHPKQHAHDGVDGSGQVNHGSLTGVTADQHHAKAHAHDGTDGSGQVSHANLTGVTADQHHAQAHSDADHTGPNRVAVQDEGTAIATRATLNFTGAGVTVSDDAANNRVNIDIPGGSGGGPHTHPYTDITTSGMKQTLVLTAAAGSPSGTSGASGPTKVSFPTNNRDVWVLDFSNGTSVTYAFWDIIMPDNWDGGQLTATFHWFANDTTTSGVRWGIAAVATGDGEALDAAFGTAAEVTDANGGVANQLRVSPATAGFLPGGTPAAGKTVTFRVYRDPAHVDDTLAATARLLKVVIEYGVTSLSS